MNQYAQIDDQLPFCEGHGVGEGDLEGNSDGDGHGDSDEGDDDGNGVGKGEYALYGDWRGNGFIPNPSRQELLPL